MKRLFRLTLILICTITLTNCTKSNNSKSLEGNWRFMDFRMGYSEIHIGDRTIEWYTEGSLTSRILFYEITGDSLKTYDSPNEKERNLLDKSRFKIINDSVINLIYFSKKKGEKKIELKRLSEIIETKQILIRNGVSEVDADKRIKDSFAMRILRYTGKDINNQKRDSILPLIQKKDKSRHKN